MLALEVVKVPQKNVVDDYTKFVTTSAVAATPGRTYQCLCGSEDEKHACKNKLNIIGLTPDKLQAALSAMTTPPKVSQIGAGDADPRLETAPPEQVFPPAPDKAPSVAAEKPVQKEEKDSAAQSPPKAARPPLTAEEKKAKRKAATARAKLRKAAKAQTGAPETPQLQDPETKRDSKRQAKLEGVTRFKMTPELETLKWSPKRVDKKGQSFQSVRLESGATLLRYEDDTVILLPKPLPRELPLAPSLSVLNASAISNTPPLSGLSNPTVQSIGSTPPVVLQSQTPPQEAKS